MHSDEMNYRVFNVGTGSPTTILDVCTVLCALYGKNLTPQIQNKFRLGDIRHCIADVGRISQFGFAPKVAFKRVMEELVAWGKTVAARDLVERAQQELKEKGLVQ